MPIDTTKLPNYSKNDSGYIWADYIELVCIGNADGETSQDDLYDFINEGSDLDIQEEEYENHPQRDDKLKGDIEEWFRLIVYRSQAYGDAYPFESSDFSKKIKLKQEISIEQNQYIFLLFSSHLSYFSRDQLSSVTKEFEQFGNSVLKKLMPPSSEVHVFGTSSSNTRYSSGTKLEKFQRLASDMGESLLSDENSFSRFDSGDGGIDHVGWFPFPDKLTNKIIFFAQSATSKEQWDIKQHSVSRDALSSKFNFSANHLSLIFIPFCFRRNDGSWHTKDKTHQKIVVVDRQRLIWLTKAEENILPVSILELIRQAIGRPA
jgi:hypothetical protein